MSWKGAFWEMSDEEELDLLVVSDSEEQPTLESTSSIVLDPTSSKVLDSTSSIKAIWLLQVLTIFVREENYIRTLFSAKK